MSVSPRLRVVATVPPELVVYDEPGECSYIAEETWRLPLRLPVRMLSREEFGQRLRHGDRRQGRLLYRTACPSCSACEPIRLEVDTFKPSRTQRRTFRRAEQQVSTVIGPIEVSDERVWLYNLHKTGRKLTAGESDTTLESYRSFLGATCCDTFEMRYHVRDELLGIAIVDRADDALSAVYFYWNPKFASLSPGVFSIMKQVELCQRMGVRYLYLGLYISACPSMSYKARCMPHQRLIDGTWETFERA